LHPIRRASNKRQHGARTKEKIDEKRFRLSCSALEGDGEGKDSPSSIAIKGKREAEDSFRTEIVLQEKSSDFQSFKSKST
jgi:hypothetical protein